MFEVSVHNSTENMEQPHRNLFAEETAFKIVQLQLEKKKKRVYGQSYNNFPFMYISIIK